MNLSSRSLKLLINEFEVHLSNNHHAQVQFNGVLIPAQFAKAWTKLIPMDKVRGRTEFRDLTETVLWPQFLPERCSVIS